MVGPAPEDPECGEPVQGRRRAVEARTDPARWRAHNAQPRSVELRRLREVAQRAGWDIVATYDETASGAVGPERRTEYAAMLKDAARRKFDVLMAWDVSRLGRSLAGLVALMEQLRALKVDLFIDQQGLDTTTPAGRAMFQMAGVFAEFERGMLIERTRAGMNRARARGIHVVRPSVGADVKRRIAEMRGLGISINRIAASLSVGKSVVCRVCRELPMAASGKSVSPAAHA